MLTAYEKFDITMQDLLEEALDRGVKAEDLFYTTGMFMDSMAFFDKIMEGKSMDYRKSTINRILSNTYGNQFFDVLLNYLDSLGTGNKNYKKLSPASIKRQGVSPFIPVDGRHRAALCVILDIKYMPVQEI